MSRTTLFTEFDYDFPLIAVVSSYRIYRFCWQLNQAMGIELCRIEDVEIEHPRKRAQQYFPLYAYEDQLSCLQYYVAGNKSNGAFLIPELKAVDYLLLLKGDAAGLAKYDLLHTLERLPGVQAFFERAPATLRSKQNLLFA